MSKHSFVYPTPLSKPSYRRPPPVHFPPAPPPALQSVRAERPPRRKRILPIEDDPNDLRSASASPATPLAPSVASPSALSAATPSASPPAPSAASPSALSAATPPALPAASPPAQSAASSPATTSQPAAARAAVTPPAAPARPPSAGDISAMILAGGLTLKDLDLIFHTLLEVLPQYHPTDAQNSLAIASDISERQRKLHLHEEFIREKALKARQLKAQCAAANAHSKALDEERRILMETYREITGDNRRKETANQLYANELPPLEELNRKAREENASTLRQIAALENAVAANDAERAQLARLALGTEQKLAVLSQQAAVTRERAKLAQEHERRLIAEITANEEAIASYNQPTANAYLEARLSATAKQIEALNEMLASALASHPTQPEELVKALTTNSQLTGKALEIYLRPAAS